MLSEHICWGAIMFCCLQKMFGTIVLCCHANIVVAIGLCFEKICVGQLCYVINKYVLGVCVVLSNFWCCSCVMLSNIYVGVFVVF